MKRHKKYFAGFLLLVISTIIVPRTYVHALVHDDEENAFHCSDSEDAQLVPMHEHCCNLQFSAPSLHLSISDFEIQPASYKAEVGFPTFLYCYHFDLFIPDLRGPPMC
ncbi:MAG: hypothetical protein EYC69_03070 [Bacteroidetes bacterium]|nr:MAG: hypothetical protein EYC69_03070 [Bacteroidota bacterium]